MKFVVSAFIIWRLFLLGVTIISLRIIPLRLGFLGGGENTYLLTPLLWGWANMDGQHYLSIAQNGYFQFEQAFFPLYPILIRLFSNLTGGNYLFSALVISHLAFLGSLLIFYKLLKIKYSLSVAKWVVVVLLVFPTSFFFASVYTEGLFFLLSLGTFYMVWQKKWLTAGILAALGGATRLVGIFLVPVIFYEWLREKKKTLTGFLGIILGSSGFLGYLFYLWKSYGDPFLFFHVQPAFGAGRSGGEIILLPQVIYRYLRIFLTASFSYDYSIALFEFIAFIFALFLLLKNFKKIPVSYQIFAWLTIFTPTLTGSLSSMPRYLLVIFPIFIALAMEKQRFKILYLILSSFILILGLMFFFRGYFVS